jgi:AcrR family transcriptional regulator
MKARMSRPERREQLLEIMRELRAKAKTKGDFTADMIASAAEVSTVLVYRYVGVEFMEMRAQLPNVETKPQTT